MIPFVTCNTCLVRFCHFDRVAGLLRNKNGLCSRWFEPWEKGSRIPQEAEAANAKAKEAPKAGQSGEGRWSRTSSMLKECTIPKNHAMCVLINELEEKHQERRRFPRPSQRVDPRRSAPVERSFPRRRCFGSKSKRWRRNEDLKRRPPRHGLLAWRFGVCCFFGLVSEGRCRCMREKNVLDENERVFWNLVEFGEVWAEVTSNPSRNFLTP